MTDIIHTIETDAATAEAKVDTVQATVTTDATSAWAAYVHGWPYWAPVVLLAAILGHYV
jgi:hypothetical protein